VRLWLDDTRDPAAFGCHGYLWAKNYDQAITALATGKVTFASLDHDLSIETAYNHGVPPPGEKIQHHCWLARRAPIDPREGFGSLLTSKAPNSCHRVAYSVSSNTWLGCVFQSSSFIM
jgi:NAD+-processing family protein with receiver domain